MVSVLKLVWKTSIFYPITWWDTVSVSTPLWRLQLSELISRPLRHTFTTVTYQYAPRTNNDKYNTIQIAFTCAISKGSEHLQRNLTPNHPHSHPNTKHITVPLGKIHPTCTQKHFKMFVRITVYGYIIRSNGNTHIKVDPALHSPG